MLNRIKEFRKLRKMTQETLAELTGLTQGQIVRIEKGQTDIGIEQLCVFAKALNVSFIDLLPPEIAKEYQLTPEERQILDMIRKTTVPDNSAAETPKAE